MTPEVYWKQHSPASLIRAIRGYGKKLDREFDLHIQDLRIQRWIGAILHNSNVKKGHRKRETILYPLPKDNIQSNKPLVSKEQHQRAVEAWDKLNKNGGTSRST